MRRLLPLIASLSLAFSARADLKVIAHYPIPGPVRFDYLRVDPDSRRLYVAHGDRMEVLDADSGRLLGSVAPTPGVHGVALVPALGRGFITAGADRSVVVFDLASLKVIKVIGGMGVKPDAIEYDDLTRRVYVANGTSGGITVIDPESMAITGVVPISGKLEGMAFDGHRLFVNTEDQSAIQVVDTASLSKVATWPIAPAEGGTGLAIDTKARRLFSAGGNEKLAVVDIDTGKVVATPAIGEDPDGDAFDAARGLIYSSSVMGTVSVLKAGTYEAVQTVETAYGARTIALDPKTGRVFVATGKFGPAPAATPDNPKPRKPSIPGTFEVLVVGQ
jgi:DNA-binding beta-propeller fold protein YncE